MPRRIVPGAVVARIWSMYRADAALLLPAAVVLSAVQLGVALLLPTALALLLTLVFWVLSLLYQGFVVEVVAVDAHGAGGTQVA